MKQEQQKVPTLQQRKKFVPPRFEAPRRAVRLQGENEDYEENIVSTTRTPLEHRFMKQSIFSSGQEEVEECDSIPFQQTSRIFENRSLQPPLSSL